MNKRTGKGKGKFLEELNQSNAAGGGGQSRHKNHSNV